MRLSDQFKSGKVTSQNKNFSPNKPKPTSMTRRNSNGGSRPIDKVSTDSQDQCEYYAFNPNEIKAKERGGDSGGTDMPLTIIRDDLADTF